MHFHRQYMTWRWMGAPLWNESVHLFEIKEKIEFAIGSLKASRFMKRTISILFFVVWAWLDQTVSFAFGLSTSKGMENIMNIDTGTRIGESKIAQKTLKSKCVKINQRTDRQKLV